MANGLPELNTNYTPAVQLDIGKTMLTAAALKEAQAKSAMTQMALRQQMARQQALSGLAGTPQDGTMPGSANPVSGGADYNSAIQKLAAAGDLEGASQLALISKATNRADPELRQKQIEVATKALDYGVKVLPTTTLSDYPRVRQELLGMMGVQAHPLLPEPEKFQGEQDFGQYKKWAIQQTIPIKDQLDLQKRTHATIQVGDEAIHGTYDARGNFVPTVVGGQEARGSKWSPNTTGLDVVLPDGTQISTGGKKGDAQSGLGKQAQNKVEESLVTVGEKIRRVADITQNFDPKFLELPTRWGADWTNLKEKLGINPPEEAKKSLEEFATFRQKSVNNMNEGIKEITGAAMSEPEARRIMKGMPDVGTGLFDGDGPTVFKSKMDATRKELKMVQARLDYIRRHGFSVKNDPTIFDKISLNEKNLVQRVAGDAEKFWRAWGIKDENEIKKKTLAVVADQFGFTN